MNQIKHKLKRVTDKIFALEIPNDWDRAMTFLRAQEFYESADSKFRGKDFDIWDYMKWYAYSRPGATEAFSYTRDWAAFNIPVKTIVQCLDKQTTPLTPYDIFMDEILHQIFNKYEAFEQEAYLIGVDQMDGRNLNHEMSHAIWYTQPEYRERATKLIKSLPKVDVDVAKGKLSRMGYTKEVLLDEITAYSSTGDMSIIGICKSTVDQFQQAFIDLREEFMPKQQKLKKAA